MTKEFNSGDRVKVPPFHQLDIEGRRKLIVNGSRKPVTLVFRGDRFDVVAGDKQAVVEIPREEA